MQGNVSDEAIQNRETIRRIKALYLQNKISREVAEALAAPTITRINKRAAEIDAKYNRRSRTIISFASLMR